MTRLTSDMIREVPFSLFGRDRDLMRSLNISLKGLACEAVGVTEEDLDLECLTAAAVPITSGIGVTKGFSESVCVITDHLGMKSFVTKGNDVVGMAEALESRADIIFLADDEKFLAINTKVLKYAENTRSTALGYFTALKMAMSGLEGKEVLLVGVGRVGSTVLDLLLESKAIVTVVDSDSSKLDAAARTSKNVKIERSLESAVRSASAILNASPAKIDGEWIREGCIISSPGVPYSYDEEGERKAKLIIHDTLQIGVAVMAVWSANLSMARRPISLKARTMAEAMQ
jgi:pyrrolysine biosynthesis protein PylD